MFIDACTFNSLSIRGDTVIRDISSVVSASFNRRFENLSLSLFLSFTRSLFVVARRATVAERKRFVRAAESDGTLGKPR